MTKTEFLSALQEKNPQLAKADLLQLTESLNQVVLEGLKSGGAAMIPGLVKFKAVQKAATAERQGINPFTKQPVTIAAKPATMKIKASIVKAFKEAY